MYRNGDSKFIFMALAKINPQNELANIIPEPSVELNRFRAIIQIVFINHFCLNVCKETEGLSSYLWPFATINPQNELGDIISEPHEKPKGFGGIIQIV